MMSWQRQAKYGRMSVLGVAKYRPAEMKLRRAMFERNGEIFVRGINARHCR